MWPLNRMKSWFKFISKSLIFLSYPLRAKLSHTTGFCFLLWKHSFTANCTEMVFLYSWSSALLLTGLQYNMNPKHEQSTTNCWTIILNILTFWDIFFLFQVINYFIFGNLNHFAGEALTLIISQCLFSALSVETKDNVSLAWSWWWLMGSFAVSAKAKIFCMFCGRLVFIYLCVCDTRSEPSSVWK